MSSRKLCVVFGYSHHRADTKPKTSYTWREFSYSYPTCQSIISVTAIFLILISFALCNPLPATAQSNILGASRTDSELLGYSISQKGQSVAVKPVGNILSAEGIAHLLGRFNEEPGLDLLRVQKASSDRFLFTVSTTQGTSITRRIKLSRPVGSSYLLLTGFNLSNDSYDDVAIIDTSQDRYYWVIIKNPSQESIVEHEAFYLGFHGDRVEFAFSPSGEIEFAAVRQTSNTPRTRVLLRSSLTGSTRVSRFRWTNPLGILLPLRMLKSARAEIGIALYSPAKTRCLS